MSRTNSQAKIVSKEYLVPRANRLVIKKNNQSVASDSHITDTMLRFVVEILRHHKLYNPVSLPTTIPIIYLHQFWTTINHNKNNHTFTFELDNHTFTLTPGLLRTVLQMPPPDPNNTYIQPPSEIQILEFIKTLGYDEDPETKLIAVTKMVATRLHQPWRAILSVLNRCLTGKDSSQDTFGMEVPDAMISDAIKKKAGYKYYMAKKVESEKAKIVDKPEEQHVSPIKSGRGKGFICYGDQVANVPNKHKKDVVPRKTRSLTIAEETDVGQKLKGPAVEDPTIQSLLDLRKGSKASRLENLRQKKQPVTGEGSGVAQNKYYSSSDTASDATLYSSSSDESANETDDADESDMDLSHDNP
ncbi:hypothetical protein Tco_0952752 [Tanacetum coccineum]|uniref:Uncharacterized protein n=1 Tax=Tanacetum coccineum TaxID=301880 RepID=A0ABQ5DXW7_9ASTR